MAAIKTAQTQQIDGRKIILSILAAFQKKDNGTIADDDRGGNAVGVVAAGWAVAMETKEQANKVANWRIAGQERIFMEDYCDQPAGSRSLLIRSRPKGIRSLRPALENARQRHAYFAGIAAVY